MNQSSLGLLRVKVVALAVSDLDRAHQFYGGTLGLEPAMENGQVVGFQLEHLVLMLKPVTDWYGRPTIEPNPRITLEVANARATEQALIERGVVISDLVQDYDGFLVGAFLDSEGNKLWFCSQS
ncbi:MAG: VOC family protein [Verrucomicrobiaceae bacterium]|nr:VOC family protein [Verrucomicrobiaceae bacterium]